MLSFLFYFLNVSVTRTKFLSFLFLKKKKTNYFRFQFSYFFCGLNVVVVFKIILFCNLITKTLKSSNLFIKMYLICCFFFLFKIFWVSFQLAWQMKLNWIESSVRELYLKKNIPWTCVKIHLFFPSSNLIPRYLLWLQQQQHHLHHNHHLWQSISKIK